MSLKDTLTKDNIVAMKNKDKVAKSVLTVLKSALQNEEIKKKGELTPDEELTILNRERKQTNDSITEYAKAGREDLVANEKAKLAIIEHYLPKQLTDDEVVAILKTKGYDSTSNVGKVIGEMSKELKGQIDGKHLSDIVKNYVNSLK